MSLLQKLFKPRDRRAPLLPLYTAIVERGRDPAWYRDAGVADTLDGRFDALVAIFAVVLLRLEREGETHAADQALLTEIFIEDMDGQLRQIGFGDMIVGKHIGRMMSALGGRIGAYREGLARGGDLEGALSRNLYRGAEVDPAHVAIAADRLRAFEAALAPFPAARIVAGELPA